MFKLYKEDGNLSKTVLVGWLQIVSALVLAVAEFLKGGDFSTYAALIFANGVLMIFMRNLTTNALE